MKMKLNKKGFTLAELLIVVAIIAVLVAISIPIFTAQLEKAREAVDEANLRDAYAVCAAAVLTEEDQDGVDTNKTENISYEVTEATEDGDEYKIVASVKVTQKQEDWQGTGGTVAGLTVAADDLTGWTITFDGSDAPTIKEIAKATG